MYQMHQDIEIEKKHSPNSPMTPKPPSANSSPKIAGEV